MKRLGAIISIIFILSGCGTLNRAKSNNDYYRGTDADAEVISEPVIWLVTFGMYPIFSIISLPIDVVLDTALLPIDHVIKVQKEKAHTAEPNRHKQETESISDDQKQSTLTPSTTPSPASSTHQRWLENNTK
ncbi:MULTISPECIES: YceK/YidQ family lipoprotein [Proteus]|uniref:YceK/YidQ family lipoprotein n=1 Tax=Proteus TaxID=583 RepID=UPI000D698D03|nr:MULTISPECIES: YceK/YidQ family lipoprotein [Proteus]NBM48382.1 YceK/YidQ family lipoprotein [Proteus sp. G2666]NBM79563.1 YceK/YidQ family lipoprotein [Proteus sp. G2659]